MKATPYSVCGSLVDNSSIALDGSLHECICQMYDRLNCEIIACSPSSEWALVGIDSKRWLIE